MTDDRSIELEVEVEGNPEEVWAAIATGPGISSWYVPHEIEQREGGAASASFGPGMDVAGRITGWDPPRRFAYTGTDEGPQLAFEWSIEVSDGGHCVVRLVNSGFGSGTEWDDHFDGMTEGWRTFMANLVLHLEHFAGRRASPSLPMANWEMTATDAWARATEKFGFDPSPTPGESIEIAAPGATGVVGTVKAVAGPRVSFLTTEPAEGTGFVTAEGQGPTASVSLWLYLYGDDASTAAERHYSEWTDALGEAAT